MSRPEAMIRTSGWEASGPAPASAPSSPIPVRVVAERLSLGEAHAAEVAEAERRAADLRRADLRARPQGPVIAAPPTAPVPLVGSAAVGSAVVGSAVVRSAAVGSPSDPAPSVPTVTVRAPARVVEPGLPVAFDPPARRSGVAALVALVTGRRRTGRHRPDCVRSQSWSMFSPARGPRRRGRFRARV